MTTAALPVPVSNPFRLDWSAESPLHRLALCLSKPLISRGLRLPAMNGIYQLARSLPADRPFVDRCLDAMNVSIRVESGGLDEVPAEGPLVMVANHPYGGIEGLILARLLSGRRPDVKLLANSMLSVVPELREHFFFVDPFGGPGAVQRNVASMRAAMDWVNAGHALGVFPSGEVSHLHLSSRRVEDPVWNTSVGRIVQRTGATALPVYFDGRNSYAFQLAGLAHARLRTLMLPNEMMRRRGRRVPIHIGRPVSPGRLKTLGDAQRTTDYLRVRTYLLRPPAKADALAAPDTSGYAAIAAAGDSAVVAREIEGLPARRLLSSGSGLAVYQLKPGECPAVMREIGRAREVTFRGVGEGTGKALDLDGYDEHYRQLVLWDPEKRRVAGGYRLGLVDQLFAKQGVDGLYTHTLFDFDRRLIRQLGPCLELGRSFVHPDYQRSFSPLLLLWQGIARFVSRHPRYRRLLGPVSISAEYTSMSRLLLSRFLESTRSIPALGRLLRPRHPLHFPRSTGYDPRQFSSVVSGIDDINTLVSELESDGKSMPVLLRQYLKLGGKLLGFNVDPKFGNVVDGLILIDLYETEPRVLSRYMGKERLRRFRAFHAARAA
ncbi:MAG: GNAT family N-acyltransferase [Planctomycetota bacterium]